MVLPPLKYIWIPCLRSYWPVQSHTDAHMQITNGDSIGCIWLTKSAKKKKKKKKKQSIMRENEVKCTRSIVKYT